MRDDAAYWRDRALQAEGHQAEAYRCDFERWQATNGTPTSVYTALRRHGTRITRVDTRIGDMPVIMAIRASGHLYPSDRSVGDAWTTVRETITAVIRHHTTAGLAGFVCVDLPAGILAARCRSGNVAMRVGDMQQMTSAERRDARRLLNSSCHWQGRPLAWTLAGLAAAAAIARKLADQDDDDITPGDGPNVGEQDTDQPAESATASCGS